MQNKHAPGEDGIPVELFKYDGQNYVSANSINMGK